MCVCVCGSLHVVSYVTFKVVTEERLSWVWEGFEGMQKVGYEGSLRIETEIGGPSEWTTQQDDSGNVYYSNNKTGEVTWEVPATENNQVDQTDTVEPSVEHHKRNSTKLPNNWSKHKDSSGRKYYSNNTNQHSQWVPPEGSAGDSAGDAMT